MMKREENDDKSYGSFYSDKVKDTSNVIDSNNEDIKRDNNKDEEIINENKEKTSSPNVNDNKNNLTLKEREKERKNKKMLYKDNYSEQKDIINIKPMSNSSLNSDIKKIKTETDIKEDIIEESGNFLTEEQKFEYKNSHIHNQKVERTNQYLPQSIMSMVKYEKLKNHKENLNRSFKLNLNNFPFIILSKQQEIQLDKPIIKIRTKSAFKSLTTEQLANSTNKIFKPSLNLMKQNSNISNNKRHNIQSCTIANNKKIPFSKVKMYPPIPQKLNSVAQNLISLERENLFLIQELHKLNEELNFCISKKPPIIFLSAKQRSNSFNHTNKNINKSTKERQRHFDIELEKNSNKKYLSNLICEYNNLYQVYSNVNNPEKTEELEKKLELVKVEVKKNKNENVSLKKKIIENNHYLKKSDQEQISFFRNLGNLNSKCELYKQKILKEKKENERMKKVIEKEKEKIEMLNDKYQKFQDILQNYDETPNSILNQRVNESEQNKKLEENLMLLIKKKKIISHSRNAMKNNYTIEIEKQKKYIEKLKSTILEIDDVLSSLNESKIE